jgi:hypothetical protein
MAEAASNIPTFKLVLVGDGGTGKVSYIMVIGCAAAVVYIWKLVASIPAAVAQTISGRNTNIWVDYVRQAPFDWRVREEVHRNPWC